MEKFLMVKNFQKFQHYKERNPPWIKIHQEILRDYTLASCLQDASKLHLIFIWVLASQLDNKIPHDNAFIKQQIGATENVDLDLFVKHGFLVPWVDPLANKGDTETLASCLQDASTLHTNADSEAEAEAEAETETDIKPICRNKQKGKKYDKEDLEFAQKMATDIGSWSNSFKTPNLEVWAEDIRKFKEYEKTSLELIKQTWVAIQADSPSKQKVGSSWKGWRSVVLSPSKFRKQFVSVRASLNLDNPSVQTSNNGTKNFVSA